MLIDTHSHINSERLDDCRDEIIKNLEKGRVGRVICPSFSLESSITSLALANENKRVWAALGVHPENCAEFDEKTSTWLDENLSNPKVVAVGEIGLDYHYGTDDYKLQRIVCEKQIQLAHKHNLPVVFHLRDAWDDSLALLREFRSDISKGVVHCFDGDKATAEKILELGYYISFTGLITFPARVELREVVKIMPHDKLMVETDAPYLAPQSYRGKVNRPEYVADIADMVASLWGISSEKVDEITTKNAVNFFDRMGK